MIRKVCLGLAALVCLLALPSVAHAQSAIAGVVKDSSGAVLPGVTVEAASPALIEKSKVVVTDGAGAYKIIDLRPGTYLITFTLAGFQTYRREGLELPSDFTANIDAAMKVGALEESVTVSGASPVVDVQSNVRSQVLSRETLDAVPNAHTIQSVGQLIPGVTLTSPDVGGSVQMQQTYFSVHGTG
ncbi:MAG TPA: carboxypeptidase-like regulatory domain-containing protein, partial [Vicinamibacterales bacterium]|nr:carboxypeptidase-like regulatory domain-containing protein [Vicinamibacterales bacterium]